MGCSANARHNNVFPDLQGPKTQILSVVATSAIATRELYVTAPPQAFGPSVGRLLQDAGGSVKACGDNT
eukprot:366412-Chlamydomonas_euryale.AAC.12